MGRSASRRRMPRPAWWLLAPALLAGSVLIAALALAAQGTIVTAAGTGDAGYSGAGDPAAEAALNRPADVSAWSDGSYLIADTENQRIRKVSADGRISTVAGTGTPGFNG